MIQKRMQIAFSANQILQLSICDGFWDEVESSPKNDALLEAISESLRLHHDQLQLLLSNQIDDKDENKQPPEVKEMTRSANESPPLPDNNTPPDQNGIALAEIEIIETPQKQRKMSPRERRLQTDEGKMYHRFRNFKDRIQIIDISGVPPTRYVIEYYIKSAEAQDGVITCRESHQVEITLGGEYPKKPPHCRMLTPVFHPNIDPAYICIGDHWSAQEDLSDLVIRIGEMLAYQAYNLKSPLNGFAAEWAFNNQNLFPLDSGGMIPPEDNDDTRKIIPERISIQF